VYAINAIPAWHAISGKQTRMKPYSEWGATFQLAFHSSVPQLREKLALLSLSDLIAPND
jgi:hypothetical protein